MPGRQVADAPAGNDKIGAVVFERQPPVVSPSQFGGEIAFSVLGSFQNFQHVTVEIGRENSSGQGGEDAGQTPRAGAEFNYIRLIRRDQQRERGSQILGIILASDQLLIPIAMFRIDILVIRHSTIPISHPPQNIP